MKFECPNQFELLIAPTATRGIQKVKPQLSENMDSVIALFPKIIDAPVENLDGYIIMQHGYELTTGGQIQLLK
jgi:hypothetical protein